MRRLLPVLALLALPASATAQERLLQGLRAAAEANPRDASAQLALGRALRRAGHFDEAVPVLRRFANRDVETAYEFARIYFDLEQHHPAKSACQRVKALARKAAIGHVCDGFAWLAWRRESRAAEAFQKALSIEPSNANAYVGLGDGRRMLSATEEAEGHYRRALEIDPSNVEAHLGLVELYLATTGRAQEARPHIRAALRADPDSARAQLLCARMVGRGRWAAAAVRKALEIRPGWAEARQMLGQLLFDEGHLDEAAAEFREAIRLQDNLGLAHEGLGLCHLAAGRIAEAETELERAMEIIPNLPRAMAGLAEVQARTERVDEAVETFRRAADLAPRNPDPLLRAAEVLRAQNRNTVARGFIDRALAIDPSFARAHALLGDIYWDIQDWRHARESYESAIRGQITPEERARANERLERLRQL